MLYYIFQYLDKAFDVPGAGVFQYITFRSAMAFILSLAISTIYGKRIIQFLRNQQVGETVRELGLQGQSEKAGTPTMGGIIIILATLIPVLEKYYGFRICLTGNDRKYKPGQSSLSHWWADYLASHLPYKSSFRIIAQKV